MDINVNLGKETLSVLNRLATVLEMQNFRGLRSTFDSTAPFRGPSIVPDAQELAPVIPVQIKQPRYKSASPGRVNKVASQDTLLANMGVTSKGCDLRALASPEISRFYTKTWKRDQGNPSDPVTPGLIRVLKSRQRELGIEFRKPTGNLTIGEADALIEALKGVGRELLGVGGDQD